MQETNTDNFVKTKEGKRLVKAIRAKGFVECSAKKKENIQAVLLEAVNIVNKKKSQSMCNI